MYQDIDKTNIEYIAEYIRKSLLKNTDLRNLKNPLYKVSQIDEQIILIRFPSSNDKLSGFSTQFDKYKCIYINSAHTLGRQNNSFWHEYYHTINDMRDEMSINHDDYDNIEEHEANYFAACMLLPKYEVKDYIIRNKYNINNVNLSDLIKIQYEFRVSLQLLIIRMNEIYVTGRFSKFFGITVLKNRKKYEEEVIKLGLDLDLISSTDDFCVPSHFFVDMHSNLENNRISIRKAKKIMDLVENKGVVCKW